MITRFSQSIWLLSKHINPTLCFLFLLSIVIPIRLFHTGLTFLGFIDDILLITVGLFVFAVTESFSRIIRTSILLILGTGVGLFSAANILYYSYFHRFINLDTFSQSQYLLDAFSPIVSLMTPPFLLFAIEIPLVLLMAVTYTSWMHRRRRSVVLLTITVCVFFISLGIKSYHTQTEFLLANQSNPIMSLIGEIETRYFWSPVTPSEPLEKTIISTLAETYNWPHLSTYKSAGQLEYPLLKVPLKKTDTVAHPYNVVILLMECVRGYETKAGLPTGNVTPNLRNLEKQGAVFPNFYFNDTHTINGEFAMLCSQHPAINKWVYGHFPNISTSCLPQILKDLGYSTHWFSAYDPGFAHSGEFLSTHGIEHIYGTAELVSHKPIKRYIGWGPSDEDLMEFAAQQIDTLTPPFFVEIQTLSNHHPQPSDFGLALPTQLFSENIGPGYLNYLAGIHYTDYAIGRFFDMVRQKEWYANTLFLVVGDHSVRVFPERLNDRALLSLAEIEILFRGKLIMVAPGLIEPKIHYTIGSQIDIAPTVLDYLGIRAPNAFQGVSLISDEVPSSERFALMVEGKTWNIRQGNNYCFALGTNCYKDKAPLCPLGTLPVSSSHSCFTSSNDLMEFKDDYHSLKLMSDPDRIALLRRGRNLIKYNTHLLEQDAIFPERIPTPVAKNE